MANNKLYMKQEIKSIQNKARFDARRRRISSAVALDQAAKEHGFNSWDAFMDNHHSQMANLSALPTGRTSTMEAYHPEAFQEKKKEVKIVVKKRRTFTLPMEQVG